MQSGTTAGFPTLGWVSKRYGDGRHSRVRSSSPLSRGEVLDGPNGTPLIWVMCLGASVRPSRVQTARSLSEDIHPLRGIDA
jgi:hypothetical protein